MNTEQEFVVDISDYDNRWNKIAAEIAREHLKQSATDKLRKYPAKDNNKPVPSSASHSTAD